MAEWLRSGLQSRSHRFDSGRRLYWDCAPKGRGVEQTFGQGPEREALNGGLEFVGSGGAEVDLCCRDRRVAKQRLGVPYARVLRYVIGVGVPEQVGVERGGDPGPAAHALD